MKYCAFLLLAFTALNSFTQARQVDTIYFSQNWEIVENNNDAEYYRIASISRLNKHFIGKYQDHFAGGELFAVGYYDEMGRKDSLFCQYYRNGVLKSEGNFHQGRMKGKWNFYHDNVNLKESLRVDDDQFYLMIANNEEGKRQVKNGTGKWKMSTTYYPYGGCQLTTRWLNGKRWGRWTIRNQENRIVAYEVFRNGKLRKGWDIHRWDYNTESFIEISYYPEYLDQVEFACFGAGDPIEYPKYPGGLEYFYAFISRQNLKIPLGKSFDRLMVHFRVDEEGTVSHITVMGCDDLEMRAIITDLFKASPKWIPGKVYGRTRPVYMSLPLDIKRLE